MQEEINELFKIENNCYTIALIVICLALVLDITNLITAWEFVKLVSLVYIEIVGFMIYFKKRQDYLFKIMCS